MAGTKFPIHQLHDMSKPVAGYIENARVIADPTHPCEWCLIGDVFIDEGKVEDLLGGISVSGTEMLRRTDSATALVYVPFPQYNDQELIQALIDDKDLNVGKWIKKAAEPIGWIVIVSVLAFAVTPIWDDIYKRKIAPRIDELLVKYISTFQRKGLTPELAQVVFFRDAQVEVRLIPVKGQEAICLRSECVFKGLETVVAFLKRDPKANEVGVKRIVVFYNEGISAFALHRVEYSDGIVEHVI
jgi:hypothetical protein